MNKDNINILNNLYKKYNLNTKEIDIINKIIFPIFIHDEFQKRMTKDFYHHGKVTLGEHIIEDAIVSYILATKSRKKINIELTLVIAMLHDLYVKPYQNVVKIREKSFFNKHGFRHPIEAAINSYKWFPKLFDDKDNARIIIDGIIHHMYPLPVQSFYKEVNNKFDLNNYDLLVDFPNEIIEMIVESSKRGRIGRISFASPKYREGKILSKADKIVSAKQIRDLKSMMALLTGKNSSLLKEEK